MAKPNIPNQKSKYNALNNRLSNYVALVRQIYDVLNLEAAKMAESVKYKDEGKEFHFKDYPELTDRVKKLQSSFVSDISLVIYTGTSQEWKNSNLVQDLVADKVLKTYGARVSGQKYKLYYQTNSDALKAFQERKDRGLSLSQKIWNQSQNYKTELEYAISTAIQKGTSAVTLSKRISKYLLDFKSLQKDYKTKYGKAVDCHDCEYRSIRLARSEINLAYRTAEQKRWEQMDFVVGQEVKLSNNHTCNGVPFTDICDDLKGKYPKDFKFTGWHPMCRCYVIPILKTEEEFWAEGDVKSKNSVDDIPPQFKEWINDNTERIKKAKAKGTLPYFVRDNKSYTEIQSTRINKRIVEPTPLSMATAQLNVAYKHFDENKYINNADYQDRVIIAINYFRDLYGANPSWEIDKITKALGVNLDYKAADRIFRKMYFDNSLNAVFSSINKIDELKKVDLNDIYPNWLNKYNEYINRINSHNISKDGYIGIYRDIEGAYNIYKLSTDKECLMYGLDKLSRNTPYKLIEIFRDKKIDIFANIADKSLFDAFEEFVPLVEGFTGNSHFHPAYNHIRIVCSQAFNNSKVARKNVQCHEYGHALDRLCGNWRYNKEWTDLFEKYETAFNTDVLSFGKQNFYGYSKKSSLSKEFNKMQQSYDNNQYVSGLSDVYVAFDKNHSSIGYGEHDVTYFSSRERCLAEFIAHASEIYWVGNPLFKKLEPSLYEDMKQLFERMFKNL